MSRRPCAIIATRIEPMPCAESAAETEPVTRSLLPSLAVADPCPTGGQRE